MGWKTKPTKENILARIQERREETDGSFPCEDTEKKLLWMVDEYFPFEMFDGCSGISNHGWTKAPFCLYHDVVYQFNHSFEKNKKTGEYEVKKLGFFSGKFRADYLLYRMMKEFDHPYWSKLRLFGLTFVGWPAWLEWRFGLKKKWSKDQDSTTSICSSFFFSCSNW